MAETPQWIEVSAGLVFRNGRLLITQRRLEDHLGGLWEFPGGKKQLDETDEACLIRELREELAIEVEVKELLATVDHRYPEKAVRLKFFRCIWKQNEPQALACHDFAWIKPEQLDEYQFPKADAQLLEKLPQMAQLWS